MEGIAHVLSREKGRRCGWRPLRELFSSLLPFSARGEGAAPEEICLRGAVTQKVDSPRLDLGVSSSSPLPVYPPQSKSIGLDFLKAPLYP